MNSVFYCTHPVLRKEKILYIERRITRLHCGELALEEAMDPVVRQTE